jgi:hypothetical protein
MILGIVLGLHFALVLVIAAVFGYGIYCIGIYAQWSRSKGYGEMIHQKGSDHDTTQK